MKQNLQKFSHAAAGWLYGSRRKLATLGFGLLVCLLGWHVVFGANGLLVYGKKRQEYRQVQEQNRALQQQNEELEKQNRALKNDSQAIEKEARERLHYARSGEVIYTVPAKPAEQQPHK